MTDILTQLIKRAAAARNDTSGAPYCDDPDLLMEAATEIDKLRHPHGHTWNFYSSTMVKCPWCGQVRQTTDGKEYLVVTLGAREPSASYADIKANRKTDEPDPDICVERRIIDSAPLRRKGQA